MAAGSTGGAEDLSIANARLKALIDVGLDLAAESDSDQLLQRVCTAARDLLDATYVTVGILDPNDRTVRRFFTCGADAIRAPDATPWIKTGDTLPGMLQGVVDERQTIRGDNPGGDPATLQLPPPHPKVQAFVAAPIASPAHVYGWLCVVGNEGRTFTANDDYLVTALAGQVGRIYELEQAMIARKQAELALGDSERRFSATFEQAGIGMALVATNGHPVEANAALRAMLGYTATELAGLSFDDFTHPEDVEADKALFRELVAGKFDVYHLEKRYIRKNRQEIWGRLTVSLVRGPTGQPQYAVGMVEDITTRKQGEETLRQSEILTRSLVEHIPQRIFLKDRNSEYVFCNSNYAQDLGIEPKQIVGKDDFAFFSQELAERYRFDDRQVMADGTIKVLDERYTVAGLDRWIHTVKVPYRDAQGGIIGILGLFEDITERQRAEELRQRSAAELQESQRIAGIGSWEWTIATGPVVWSEGMNHLLGRDRGSLAMTFEAISQFYTPESWERLSAVIARTIETGAPYELELEMIHADGTTCWTTTRGEAIRGTDGAVVELRGTVHDITERRRADAQLRNSEARYRQIVETAQEGIWAIDPSQTVTFANAKMADLLGCTVDDLIGAPLSDFMDDEARAVARLSVARRERGIAEQLEIRYRRKDGTFLWALVNANPMISESGTYLGALAMVSDISERRRAEETLRLQSAALHVSVSAIVITETTGAIAWVNPAFTLLTGYTAEEALGKNPGDLQKSGKHYPAFYKDLWDTILAGRTWRGEMINRRKDGSLYTERQIVTPILDASRSITHFVAIKEDITERLQLEAQVRQVQKMESVGQLASGIAHDFNNLLTVINGTSDLLLAQVGSDSPMHTDLRDIFDAGERAALLTGQLLAFSRQQILMPQVVSLNTLVAGIESLLRRLLGEDIDMVIVLTPDVGSVKVDPGQIEQVITNLAVNGRDAMPQGGRLTIETQRVTIEEVDAHPQGDDAVPPGSYICLVVTDSGVGMDVATRAHIYEPFFTTKEAGRGTGLGLATVYGIVKQSQGFIRLSSEVGQGTSFKIFLPLVADVACGDRPTPMPVSSSGSETILLVEDNAGLRKLVARALEPAGYTVLRAATGEEALRLLQGHEQEVQLLLSDVVMPGMGGRHLAEQVARTRPRMKVLYMSGYTSDTILRHGVLEAEMPFIGKPFTAATLLRKVREVLDS